MVAFLLKFEGKNSDVADIRNFIFHEKKLGRIDSSHFLAELMPLPKQSMHSIQDYKSIWNSINDYYEDVSLERFSLIKSTILQNNNVRLIVSYDRTMTQKMLEFFATKINEIESWQFRQEQYKLYKIEISKVKSIFLLTTPFFGNGRISYEGIKDSAVRMKNFVGN
jgi:hypothetical protein